MLWLILPVAQASECFDEGTSFEALYCLQTTPLPWALREDCGCQSLSTEDLSESRCRGTG